MPVQTRCDVSPHEGCFNEKGPRAAARIHHQPVLFPEGKLHQCCSQGFFHWCLHIFHPVAPLMESRTGGIQGHSNPVLQQGDFDIIQCPAFREIIHPITFLQTFHHGLFCHRLAGRHAGKLRLHRGSVDDKFSVHRDPLLPGDALHLLEQIFKLQCCKLCHLDLNPVCGPQPEVRPDHSPFIPQKCDFGILRPQDLISQCFNFPFYHRFQSEGSCCNQFQFHVSFCPFPFLFFSDLRIEIQGCPPAAPSVSYTYL